MAEFVVTGPDGKEYDVTAPEGASEEQIIGKVRSYVASTAKPEQPSEEDTLEAYLQASADYENVNRTALGRGFRRSVDLTGEGVGSAIEGLGSVLGLEGLEEYGADMALENEAQLQRAEASATRRQDVKGLGTGASYFGETLAESSVPMGIGIGTGALTGALVGGGIPGAIIGAGAAALSQLPLFYGWNRQRQKEAVEQGIIPEVSEGAAFLSAIPQAAAEGIVDRLLVGGFFARPFMKQGGVLTRIGKGSVRGAAAEIPTEIGQQVIERAQAGLSLTSDEAISEYIDAGVAAGMIGSTVGGAGNIRGVKREETDPTDGIQGELFGDDVDLGIKPGQRELFDDDVDLGIKPITVPTKDKDQAEFDFEGTEKSTAEPSVTKETKTGATQTEFDFEDRPITASPDTALSAAMKKAVGDVKQEKQFNEAELALARQKTLEKIQAEETKREDAKKTEDLSPPPEVEREEVQDSLFGLGRKYEEKQRQASIDAQKPISVPNTITTELLDKLGIRASAPIRKRIIDKDLSDPAVRQELIKHANNRGVAQQTKLNISNYLRGTPEEQGDLFPPRRRKKDADIGGADTTGSGAGVQNVVSETDDTDAKKFDAPEEAGVDSTKPGPGSDTDTEVDGDDTLTEVSTTKNKQPNGDYIISKVFRDKNGKSQVKRYTVENPKNNPETKSWLITPEGVDGDATDAANSLGDAVKLIEGFQETEVATEILGDDTLTEENIFPGATVTSLEGIQTGAALTPSQKANIDVVREKFTPQIDKIRKDKTIPAKERRKQIQALNGEMMLAINDIKQGIPQAETEAARREKGKEFQAAEVKRDEAQLAELDRIAAGEQAGLDASARKNVEKQASLGIINTTKEAFEKKGKAEKARLQRAEKEFSTVAIDPYDRGTKGGALDSSDLQKIQDLVTSNTLPKTDPLFRVQERLRKAPYPADVLLDDAPHEIVGKVKRTQKASTKDPKTGKETVTELDAALNERMQNSVEASALSIEKWVNENLSEKAKEKFASQKEREITTNKEQKRIIQTKTIAEDQVKINRDNIKIANEKARFEAGEINKAQYDKNLERIQKESGIRQKDELLLPLDSVSNLDAPMHPVVVEMLAAGNLEAALKGLAITSQSTRVSALAKVLADNIGTTKLEVVETLDSAGVFDPKTNTIKLNATTGLNTHTLLHEMTHAAVSANLRNKSHPTTAQLNTLFKKVKSLLPTAYGSTNLDEFVSEAMSNPEFQTTLASINIQGEPVSVYRRFMNIVANFGRRLAGVSPVSLIYMPNINDSIKGLDVFSAIDTLVQGNNLFDALIAPAPEYRNADMLPLNATAGGVNEMAKAFDTIQKKINSYDGVKSFGNSMLDILKNLRKSPRVGILKILGTQALADVAEKAGFGKLAENLHIAIEEQRGAMMESDAALDIVMRDLANFRKDNPKLKVVMDKLIYDADYGSTINQVDPLLSQADAEAQYLRYKFEYLNDKGDLKTKSFKTKKDRDAEYKKFTDPKYEAEKLNPESEKMDIWKLQQKELNKLNPADRKKLLAQYTALRNTYRNMYEKLKDVLFGRVDAALAEDPDAAKKLKSSVFKKIFRANTLAVYFPLTREGNFKLTYAYKSVDEAPESEANPSYVVRMFKSETERDRAAAEIRKDNKFERVETSDGDFKEAHFENAPSFSFVGKTLDALKKGDVKEDVRTEIVQLFIDTLPETSFAKSFKKRENIEGFIEDSLDAFRIKAYDLGRQTERLVHGKRIKDIEQQISGLKVPDPAAMKAKSLVGRGTEAITASFADLKKELLQRGSFARNPPSEPLFKKANQFAFIYTIGFNVSSAIVNLSQVPLFVMPYLGAKYGYKQTMSDITTSGKLVTAAKNNILSMYNIDEQGNYAVKSDIPENLKAEYELIKPVVQMASKRGLLTTSFLKDALGLDESGRKRSIGDSISSMSAFFFNHGERFNRQTTILAGYKLELAKLQGKNKTATTEQKTAAAKQAIRQAQETNGGAVLETAPAITQKSFGRVAFMYKSYGLQMYYTMLKSAKTMMDTDMNAEERKIAAKQLAGVHGTALFFAGVHGVPLYGAFSVLYNLLIAGEDDDDFDTVVRKTIGEGWYKGVPAMSGIDPSNRIRLTGLLLQENKFDRNSDLEGLIGFHLGGPALSSAKRILRGAKDLYDGQLMRGTESLLPAGVANAYKTVPFLGRISREEGYRSRRGDIIYDDVNVLERAGQFLGFAPTGYMLEQERNNIIKGIDTAISKKRSKLLKQYYVAKRTGDLSGMRKARREMREFSKKHREAAITAETIDRSMKQHVKTSLEMYNGIRLNPQMRETLKNSRDDWDQGLQLFS